ncbi:MAG: CDP-alcohol phosphatidyltransferase family protein [Candidatus Dormibacteria bacterium]
MIPANPPEGAMAPNPFLDQRLGALREEGFTGAALRRFASAFWQRSRATAAARPDLVNELRVVRRVGTVLALGVGIALRFDGVPVLAGVLLPAATWLVLCGWVWVELGLVRHPISGAPGPRIGPANVMTLYRGWAAVPVMLIATSRGGPSIGWVLLCLTAGLTDLLDGTVAIRLGHESRLGRLTDPVLDACFFSAAAFSLARWHLFPGWLALLVSLRYFAPVVGGLGLLFVMGRSLPVRHTPWGQRSTMATAAALSVTWLSSVIHVPAVVLWTLYAAAVVCMALALGGILRRAPRGA